MGSIQNACCSRAGDDIEEVCPDVFVGKYYLDQTGPTEGDDQGQYFLIFGGFRFKVLLNDDGVAYECEEYTPEKGEKIVKKFKSGKNLFEIHRSAKRIVEGAGEQFSTRAFVCSLLNSIKGRVTFNVKDPKALGMCDSTGLSESTDKAKDLMFKSSITHYQDYHEDWHAFKMFVEKVLIHKVPVEEYNIVMTLREFLLELFSYEYDDEGTEYIFKYCLLDLHVLLKKTCQIYAKNTDDEAWVKKFLKDPCNSSYIARLLLACDSSLDSVVVSSEFIKKYQGPLEKCRVRFVNFENEIKRIDSIFTKMFSYAAKNSLYLNTGYFHSPRNSLNDLLYERMVSDLLKKKNPEDLFKDMLSFPIETGEGSTEDTIKGILNDTHENEQLLQELFQFEQDEIGFLTVNLFPLWIKLIESESDHPEYTAMALYRTMKCVDDVCRKQTGYENYSIDNPDFYSNYPCDM